MPQRARSTGRRRAGVAVLTLALAVSALAAGLVLAGRNAPDAPAAPVGASEPPAATPAPSATPSGPAVASGANVNAREPDVRPTAVAIPAIGVTSELDLLGLAADGTAEVPADPDRAGWFTGGAVPGEPGPAVIAGHVDSRSGPGVFYRLGDLRVGDAVTVDTTAGPVGFVVERVERVPKDAFPTESVYGPVPEPALRLVTCGGEFDPATGHYRDNVVAYLGPAATGPPAAR